MNDEPIEPSDILFEKSLPRFVRLGAACALTFIMIWVVTGFFLEGRPAGRSLELISMSGISIVLICFALFQRDIRWILRAGELQIHEDSITGDRETKFVRTGEITKITVVDDTDVDRAEFYIRIWLADGGQIRSPLMRDAKRANEVVDQIMQRLQVPPHHRAATSYRRILE